MNEANTERAAAVKIPAFTEYLIIAYSVRTFAKPGFNHGKNLGNGDSKSCKTAAEAISIAKVVYFFVCPVCILL